jgi:hypothetical protein
MTPAMPADAPEDTADRQTLRWCVRSDGRSGFLFVNNHQPVEELPTHHDVQFAVELDGRELVVPSEPVTVPSGAYFVWPLARPIGGSLLLTATAQPMGVLDADEPVHVFGQTAGIPVELVFDAATVTEVEGPAAVERTADLVVVTDLRPGSGCLLRVRDASGGCAAVLVLDAASALTAARGRLWGADRLVLSERPAVIEDDRLVVYGQGSDVRIFPVPSGAARTDGVFGLVPLPAPVAQVPEVKLEAVKPAGPVRRPVVDSASGRASAPTDADFDQAAVYRITVPEDAFTGEEEVLLRLDWVGDVGRAYIGGRLVADQFWYGPVWEIGLRRFLKDDLEHGLELRLLPLREGAPLFVSPQVRPAAYPGGSILELRSATLIPIPRTVITGDAR